MNANDEPINNGVRRNLYVLRDSKLAECNPPVCYNTHAAALRAFGDLVVNDKQTAVSLHPEDYALYFVGAIDVNSGCLYPVEPVLLGIGSDFRNKE